MATRVGAFLALAVISAYWIACVNARFADACDLLGQAEPVDTNCLRKRPVERYLAVIRDEVLERYVAPPVSKRAYVELRYVLNRDGSAQDRCVAKSSDPGTARNLIAAFDAAAPFDPVPRYARCMVGNRITRHIYTPGSTPTRK